MILLIRDNTTIYATRNISSLYDHLTNIPSFSE
jgi:hypothetical protein